MVAVVTGRGETYFEIVCILLVVYSFGQQVAARARDRAVEAALGWMRTIATCRLLEDDGTTREIPAEELPVGKSILVHPGETIPADGVVVDGTALVREAEMTGEHFAVARHPGESVWAGTVLLDASLVVRSTAAAGRRRIDRIIDAVDRARSRRASIELTADRIVARLLPAVLALAAITFAGWSWHSGWSTGLFNAMSVLLVACPCALGLATPVAIWAAIGRMAGRGIIARGGDVVEHMAGVDTVLFDKTGTLTGRAAELVDLAVRPSRSLGAEAIRELLAVVEEAGSHPVAEALAGIVHERTDRFTVVTTRVLPGTGLAADVRDAASGKNLEVTVGTIDRLEISGSEQAGLDQLAARLRAPEGAHRIAAVVGGRVVALAAISERLAGGWDTALQELHALGLEVWVVTGDRDERARGITADRVLSQVSPEEKMAEVERLKDAGRTVLFAGDGVNDAAALAAADVGVGVAGGAELAEELGDATWHGGDVETVPWAIMLARETRRLIRTNLWFAFLYNVSGIALAMAGLLHPVTATLLMVSSSLVVTWRAGSLMDDGVEEAGRTATQQSWKESPA